MDFKASTFAILDPQSNPIGTGFLVTSRFVLTCAHVIIAAGAGPGGTIRTQCTGNREVYPTVVVPEFWRDRNKGDLAILSLESAIEAIVPLQLGWAKKDSPFNSFGYAWAGDVQGILVQGKIQDLLPQIDLLQLSTPQAQQGISGAPVYDEIQQAVVGMFLKGDPDASRKIAFAIPSEKIWHVCTALTPKFPNRREEATQPLSVSPQYNRNAYLQSILENVQQDWDRKYYVPLSGAENEVIPPQQGFQQKRHVPRTYSRVLERRESADSAQQSEFQSFKTIEEAVEKYKRFMLLGAPGAGKTTILTKLLMDSLERALRDPRAPVPLFIQLGESWDDDIADFSGLIEANIRLYGIQGLHSSELLLLLDGLDQVPLKRVEQLRKWLAANRNVPVVVSCRTNYRISGSALGISTIKISDLDEEQIKDILIASLGSKSADAVMRRLQPDPVRPLARDLINLAGNPFFLRIIADTHDPNNPDPRIPSSQGQLFKLYIETLYERQIEHQHQPLGNIELKVVLLCLGKVAYALHQRGSITKYMNAGWARRQLPSEYQSKDSELWHLGQEMSILELKKDGQLIRFTHDLLVEYFAAEYIAQSLNLLKILLMPPSFSEGERRFNKWDQTVYMLAGLCVPKEIISIITSINPFLAAECLAYLERDTQPDSLALENVVKGLAGYIGSADLDVRQAAIKSLSQISEQEYVITHMKQVFQQKNAIEHKAAIVVLANSMDQERASAALVEALRNCNKFVRRDATDALEAIGDPAASAIYEQFRESQQLDFRRRLLEVAGRIHTFNGIQTLLWAIEDPEQKISQAAYELLDVSEVDLSGATANQLSASRAKAHFLLSSANANHRKAGVRILGILGTSEDAVALSAILKSASVEDQKEILRALGKLNDSSILTELISQLQGGTDTLIRPDGASRKEAAVAIGLLRDPSAIPVLQETLSDFNPHVRSAAAQALGRLRAESAVSLLIERVTNDSNHFVKAYSALALGLIGDSVALPVLISALNNPMEKVRSFSAMGLGLIGNSEAKPHLVRQLLNDPIHYVRQSTVCALALFRSPDTCEPLTQVIKKDGEHYVRQWATIALGVIGDGLSLGGLEIALSDSSRYVRHKAVAALKYINHPRTAFLLTLSTQDDDDFVRQQAVMGLGIRKAINSVEYLWELRDDRNEHVRAALVWAFSQINYNRAVNYLIDRAQRDPSHIVRSRAVEALRNMSILPGMFSDTLMHVVQHDPVDFVRKMAIETLRNLHIQDAIPLLAKLAESDPSAYVRREAKNAIKSLKKTVEPQNPDANLAVDAGQTHSIGSESDMTNPPTMFSTIDDKTGSPDYDILDDQVEPAGAFHRLSMLELSRRQIEDGDIYKVLEQVIMDPRRAKRHMAMKALWSDPTRRRSIASDPDVTIPSSP